MTTKPATPQLFTAQELFDAVAGDPRVKAYPRLIEALREVYEIEEGPGETDRPQWGKVRALLRELGEI